LTSVILGSKRQKIACIHTHSLVKKNKSGTNKFLGSIDFLYLNLKLSDQYYT
jgi:hypothetical protein